MAAMGNSRALRATVHKMRSWQAHSFGGPEQLQLTESARVPAVTKPGQVLVKVAAASLNPIDGAMLGGYGSTMLHSLRRVERPCDSAPLEFPLTLGRDFAGEVVECGLGVRSLSPGDQVWGVVPPQQQGSLASYVVADCVSRRPESFSVSEAASLPYAALTAWSALWLSAGMFVWPARKVLVLGGAGGVGTAALQLLKVWGAQVVTTCRGDAVPLLESLGADAVLDYTSADCDQLIKEQGPYDVVLNAAGLPGTPHLDQLREWHLGRYVTLSPPLLRNTDQLGLLAGGLKSIFELARPNLQALSARGASVRWAFFVPSSMGLAHVTKLATAGKLCPVIDSTFDFCDTPAAFERLAAGHLRGKVVLRISPEQED